MTTIKTIKNNYNLLTKQERFGLYQKASLRRDESELSAIYSATPTKTYDVIDFYFLRDEIYRIDTVNLLSRLSHSAMFQTFLIFADERDENKSEYFVQAASMSAYLYVIETDAWTAVCEELGFEVNWFRSLSSQISYAVEVMELRDKFLRDCAFSETEAQTFIKKGIERQKIKDFVEVKTLDIQIKFYRDFIEEL